MQPLLNDTDRAIINNFQGGFPISERPYADAAAVVGVSESELLRRIESLIERGLLSRFGPMYRAERMGGAVTLAALAAPEERYDEVADIVNAFPEVAHNYEREHALNMWFVLAVDRPERIDDILIQIEKATGCAVYNMPKLDEFYIGLRLEV